MSVERRKFSMKIPGRSETTAGSAASKSFSISRAGPTAPRAGARVGPHARDDDRSAHAGLLRGRGGLLRALDGPGVGCPLPGVVSDALREKAMQGALDDELGALSEAFRADLCDSADRAAREAALGALALMAGGLALSRALGKTARSDEVLRACRNFGQAAVANLGRSINES